MAGFSALDTVSHFQLYGPSFINILFLHSRYAYSGVHTLLCELIESPIKSSRTGIASGV